MDADVIAEVGIDDERRIFVRPETAAFPYMYREAMDVHWDPAHRRLHSPVPREWTYLRWFQQILAAAAEQSYELRLTPTTTWTNVPSDLRAEIEHWRASRDAKKP